MEQLYDVIQFIREVEMSKITGELWRRSRGVRERFPYPYTKEHKHQLEKFKKQSFFSEGITCDQMPRTIDILSRIFEGVRNACSVGKRERTFVYMYKDSFNLSPREFKKFLRGEREVEFEDLVGHARLVCEYLKAANLEVSFVRNKDALTRKCVLLKISW